MKKTSIVFAILLSITLLSVVLTTMPVHKAATQVDIYAGEKSTSTYGFGNSAISISSPGPTLTFTSGDTVTVTLHNAGTMAHNFAIVDTKSSTGTVLWNAQVALNKQCSCIWIKRFSHVHGRQRWKLLLCLPS